MSISDASTRLGYTAKSAGLWLEGINGFGQFRPNTAWKNDASEKKAPKYRTATGETYDAMLPRHPDNPRYWEDLAALKAIAWTINGHPCLGLTEGMFKAISGCCNALPTVALAGVQQGLTPSSKDPQGKRYLVETLENLCREGFGWIIAFDADAATKKEVRDAQRVLGHQLTKFNVPVYIATGLWSIEQGKGMDDYIKNCGADTFMQEVIRKVVDLATYEKQFQENAAQEARLSQLDFSRRVAEKYRAQMAWNVQAKAWYWYGAKKRAGVWGEIPPEEASDVIITELETQTRHATYAFIMGVLNLLKAKLRVNEWEVTPGLICLEDCVIDIHTLETREHAPGYRFLSRLPFKWSDREIGCEPIKQWLLETCGNRADWVEVIRAGMNATLTERGGELQRYMELIGAGGTGKGTILRLVQGLLGKENYAVTTLDQLEQNRFETAMFYGKKGVFITDAERFSGKVNVLKALTGQDELRIEKKGVQQTGNFVFPGVVWVAANEAIQSTDYTNALPRRRVSMSFERVTSPDQRRDLMEEFRLYLPGLLFWILSMDSRDVALYLRDTARHVPSLGAFGFEILMETNPLANWADQYLYSDPTIETKIGDAAGNPDSTLYANYSQWASANGQNTMTTQRFSSNLLNLLKSQLGINAVKRKTNKGRFITCIGIRQPGHNFPLLISGAGDDLVTTQVTTESLGSDDTQQSDDPNADSSISLSSHCDAGQRTENKSPADISLSPSPASVSGRHLQREEPLSEPFPTVTREPETTLSSKSENAQALAGDDTQTITQQIMRHWDNPTLLGNLILRLADSETLRQETRHYTPEQLQHIKNAANSTWKLGIDVAADYNGELVYIWECGQSKEVRIGTKTKPTLCVKRANLRPWLGL